jgi:small conductance mechanosensitive channel
MEMASSPKIQRARVLGVAWFLSVAFGIMHATHAQSKVTTGDEKPSPVTTTDATIPVEHLELLVKPLTMEELVTEVEGWRDRLKAHVQEIAQLRIDLKDQQQTVKDAKEDESDVSQAEQPTSEVATNNEAGAAAERKQALADSLPELNEAKAQLVDRLNVVLDELEAKGGDVASYRKYVSSLTGVGVEVTDTATAWTVLQGWLASEQGGQRWAWNIAKFLMILLSFYFGASIAARLVRHAAARMKGVSQLLVDFLSKFVKQVLTIIGMIVALGALEVDITPLLAALGAAGFVIGFALQGTLSNFASGLLILAYRPFDVGDVIEAAGVSGVVGSVSLFSTHIRTFDNKVMIVPNNDIWGGTITNATASDTRRVDMSFGIGYDDDIGTAKAILERLVKEHELVLDDPAPVVQLHELGDSSLNFVCRPWSKTGDYWTVYWDITRAVKEEFDRNGISIPFPQRDIHVYHETVNGSGEGRMATQQH